MAGGGGGDSEYEVNINLTALLDVLTNLLFFLMFGFAAQQVNMELEGGLTMPSSSAEAHPSKNITISVGARELKVEKQSIVRFKGGHVVGGPAQGRIEPL